MLAGSAIKQASGGAGAARDAAMQIAREDVDAPVAVALREVVAEAGEGDDGAVARQGRAERGP